MDDEGHTYSQAKYEECPDEDYTIDDFNTPGTDAYKRGRATGPYTRMQIEYSSGDGADGTLEQKKGKRQPSPKRNLKQEGQPQRQQQHPGYYGSKGETKPQTSTNATEDGTSEEYLEDVVDDAVEYDMGENPREKDKRMSDGSDRTYIMAGSGSLRHYKRGVKVPSTASSDHIYTLGEGSRQSSRPEGLYDQAGAMSLEDNSEKIVNGVKMQKGYTKPQDAKEGPVYVNSPKTSSNHREPIYGVSSAQPYSSSNARIQGETYSARLASFHKSNTSTGAYGKTRGIAKSGSCKPVAEEGESYLECTNDKGDFNHENGKMEMYSDFIGMKSKREGDDYCDVVYEGTNAKNLIGKSKKNGKKGKSTEGVIEYVDVTVLSQAATSTTTPARSTLLSGEEEGEDDSRPKPLYSVPSKARLKTTTLTSQRSEKEILEDENKLVYIETETNPSSKKGTLLIGSGIGGRKSDDGVEENGAGGVVYSEVMQTGSRVNTIQPKEKKR